MRTDISALVGARICHDLISPLGAIGNGVELLAMTNDKPDAEMALITESVASANARIRFFRIAYGSANVDQTLPRADILSVLSATARGGRMTYFWGPEGDQPRREVRIAFLILQCFETALPVGGEIRVAKTAAGWQLSASGPRLNIDTELWNTLLNPRLRFTHTAAQVQFALLPQVVADAGAKLSVEMTEQTLTAQF